VCHYAFVLATHAEAVGSFGERIMRRADGLIAISESSRPDAIRILGLAPERVAVAYPRGPKRISGRRRRVWGRPYVLIRSSAARFLRGSMVPGMPKRAAG